MEISPILHVAQSHVSTPLWFDVVAVLVIAYFIHQKYAQVKARVYEIEKQIGLKK